MLHFTDCDVLMCRDCGRTFLGSEAEHYYDSSTGANEWTCPYCGGDDYDKPNACSVCGEYTLNDMICDDCHNYVKQELQHLSFKVLDKVDISELIDVLNDVVDRYEAEERERQKPKPPPINK